MYAQISCWDLWESLETYPSGTHLLIWVWLAHVVLYTFLFKVYLQGCQLDILRENLASKVTA